MKKRHTEGEVWADGNFVMAGDYATGGEPDMLVEVQIAEFPGADAARFATTWNACDGIPTEALTPGSIKALLEAAQAAHRRLEFLHDGHMLAGEKTVPIRNIVELELLETALAPFKVAQEVKHG